MYHSSSLNSEPYHQNQNLAEGRYCTLKRWTNTIMNRTGAPADCWLLCMIHASYILNHLSHEALDGNVPLGIMAEYNPDDLIGRTFLLPKNEQGERLRATIKRKVIETSKHLDDQHDNVIEKINFHLDVGQGRAEAIMSYVQILDHLDHQEQHEDLYKFRAITGHQGLLSPQDENYKGSKYNVMVEWETGEITEEHSP